MVSWITLCCVGTWIISFSGIVASFMCSGGNISLLLMISTCYIFAGLMLYWFTSYLLHLHVVSCTSVSVFWHMCWMFFFQGFLAFLVIHITQIYVTHLLLNKNNLVPLCLWNWLLYLLYSSHRAKNISSPLLSYLLVQLLLHQYLFQNSHWSYC